MTNPRRLFRDVRTVAVGATSTQLFGPNPRRYAILLGTPPGTVAAGGSAGADTRVATGADLSVDGTNAIHVVAASSSVITFYSFRPTGGAPTIYPYVTHGGVTASLIGTNANTMQQLWIPLQTGDIFDLRVVGNSVGATGELVVGVQTAGAGGAAGAYVCFDFGRAATLNSFPLDPGALPFFITGDHIGDAIREEITAISSSGTVSISVMDIMEDCDCVPGKVGLQYPMFGNAGG